MLLEGDPIEISYNDLLDRPGNLPPITMTANPQLVSGYAFFNGVYLYESSIAPDTGLFNLTSFEDLISFDVSTGQKCPIAITLSLPEPAFVTKYILRAGEWAISPSDWTITFFNPSGTEVATDSRAAEVSTSV